MNTDDRALADLKPCPFCGEPGEIEHSYREDDVHPPRDFWHVRAARSACGVSPTGWVSYGNQEQRVANFHVRREAEASAIAAWNTRAANRLEAFHAKPGDMLKRAGAEAALPSEYSRVGRAALQSEHAKPVVGEDDLAREMAQAYHGSDRWNALPEHRRQYWQKAAALQSPPPVVSELSPPTQRMEKILGAPFVRRSPTVVSGELVTAAKDLLAGMSGTYKARNGREMGIEADDGENCWIVHNDLIAALEGALVTASTPPVVEEERREAAIDRALEIVRQVGSMEGHTHAQTYWFGKARDLINDADAILALTPVEGVGVLLAAIDAWESDPSPETEQGIMDARAGLSTPATAQGDVREALEPFAKASDIRLCASDGYWSDEKPIQGTDVAFHITFGDLKRAKAALATLGATHEG